MDFVLKDFTHEYNSGDLCGLEYLEKTLIQKYKDLSKDLFVNKKVNGWNKYDYVINLFYATLSLNSCNDMYETDSKIGGNFKYDLYFDTKDLLLTEIGKLENIDLCKYLEENWNI